jgi:endonuclease YncB( thermonuclease family)
MVLPAVTFMGFGALVRSNGSTLAAGLVQDQSANQVAPVYSFSAPVTKGEDSLSPPVSEPASSLSEAATSEPAPVPLPDVPSAYCVPRDTPRQAAKVVAITDADTLHVQLDGEVVTVRYLGLDAPGLEERLGAQAFDINRTLEGQTVVLVQDRSDKDDQGRLLRYVFAGDFFVNYQLLEWGMAETVNSDPDSACAGFFLVAQNDAKEQKIGLWEPVDVRLDTEDWQNWPVVPLISENAKNIYLAGVAAGNNPNHFSVMGDCQAPEWKLFGRYDWDTYELLEQELPMQSTVEFFAGQWSREAVTVADGNTVATLYSVYWADPNRCESAETPVDCEIRLNNPSIGIIMLGTNWKGGAEEFETRLRYTVQVLVQQNILPILVTKADHKEPDFPLNRIIAQVAYDYDIPLWNYWAAVQGLPNHGLKEDDPLGIHIIPEAYPVKRQTGLQTLHAFLMALSQP